ncbi:hypothetical protein PUN28_005346 [Cardiocondyla obscurior]|uniref:Uncharacterized protein n=1 Tax=Cardiocondyla obscurior TaxID=286306 RepID=A0AAW2GLE2_9HYME
MPTARSCNRAVRADNVTLVRRHLRRARARSPIIKSRARDASRLTDVRGWTGTRPRGALSGRTRMVPRIALVARRSTCLSPRISAHERYSKSTLIATGAAATAWGRRREASSNDENPIESSRSGRIPVTSSVRIFARARERGAAFRMADRRRVPTYRPGSLRGRA